MSGTSQLLTSAPCRKKLEMALHGCLMMRLADCLTRPSENLPDYTTLRIIMLPLDCKKLNREAQPLQGSEL
eukprot:scaffold495208_cov15-Prasinocladus_malaysianus.AAC.1